MRNKCAYSCCGIANNAFETIRRLLSDEIRTSYFKRNEGLFTYTRNLALAYFFPALLGKKLRAIVLLVRIIVYARIRKDTVLVLRKVVIFGSAVGTRTFASYRAAIYVVQYLKNVRLHCSRTYAGYLPYV